MIWKKEPVNAAQVRGLTEQYGISPLLASILIRRELTSPEDVMFILEHDFRKMHNPFLFDDMEIAVDRINSAIEESEKILIYGDRDADGMTSIALLVSNLRELGADVQWALPMGDDPYGLTIKAVEDFAKINGTLIISVDCGTTNVQEISRANELGIDTIVVDHHNFQEDIPPAFAIINPKAPDSCYPFEGLCGCGVVSKLVLALYFSRTPWYKEPVCLLQVTPGNDSIIIDAVKLNNLLEVDRIREIIVDGVVSIHNTRLVDFLATQQILVYDNEPQLRLLRRAFGNNVDFQLIDAASEIAKLFPAIKGKSLLRIAQGKIKPGSSVAPQEIDVFLSLFHSYVYRQDNVLECKLQSMLDLSALGTIADMMPLKNENRILVKEGLRVLANTTRPGLRRLLELQGLNGVELTSQIAAWQITPVLNAGGRMGKPDLVVQLLLASDPEEVKELAVDVKDMNEQRKKIGADAWKRVLPAAKKNLDRFKHRMTVVYDPHIHRGVTGIIAGRLARMLKVPSLVITDLESSSVGSVRSINNVPVTPILRSTEDLLTDWGGHDYAAGFRFSSDKINQIMERFEKNIDSYPVCENIEEILIIDAELPHEFLNPSIEEIVNILGPFGQGHGPLLFMGRRLKVENLDIVGKMDASHVKLLLATSRYKWPAMFWGAAERVNVDFKKGEMVDILFHYGKNTYQNKTIPQLIIVDIRRSENE